MLELVTMDEARVQIRTDAGAADDAWLAVWIPAISEAVAAWLKDAWRLYVIEVDSSGTPVIDSAGDPVPEVDTAGDPIVRPVVKAATLLELSSQYRFREGEGDNVVDTSAGYGYTLNKASTALLGPLRKSTIA